MEKNKCCAWGKLSTIYLLVLTSLDQLVLILQRLFTFLPNNLNEEVNCTEPSPSVRVPYVVNIAPREHQFLLTNIRQEA
jgi:hypothetical protein